MKVTKWISKEECISAIAEYLKKFDEKTFTIDDADLFYRALYGATYNSQDEKDDEDKMELWENMAEDIEEFESLGYAIEVRGTEHKFLMKLSAESQILGLYEGKYSEEEAKELLGTKHIVWMDWTPACQLKIMYGDPNTDAEFFSGDCKVEGPIKLASKPRQWIYDLFVHLEREED